MESKGRELQVGIASILAFKLAFNFFTVVVAAAAAAAVCGWLDWIGTSPIWWEKRDVWWWVSQMAYSKRW
jgi:hypothetical protein